MNSDKTKKLPWFCLICVYLRPIRSSGVHHSYLSAAMGSRREALRAGQIPKKRPTLVATLKPAITDHKGTVDGRLGTKVRIAPLRSQPKRMPIMPPEEVRVTASSRNCQV